MPWPTNLAISTMAVLRTAGRSRCPVGDPAQDEKPGGSRLIVTCTALPIYRAAEKALA